MRPFAGAPRPCSKLPRFFGPAPHASATDMPFVRRPTFSCKSECRCRRGAGPLERALSDSESFTVDPGRAEAFLPMWSSAWPPARFRPSRAGFASAQVSGVQARNGSPEDTDLERISLRGPRIKDLRDLFMIESSARSRSRTLSVLSVCEYRGGLTHQRFQPQAFWRAPAVTLIVPSPKSSLRAQRRSRSREASPAIPANG